MILAQFITHIHTLNLHSIKNHFDPSNFKFSSPDLNVLPNRRTELAKNENIFS